MQNYINLCFFFAAQFLLIIFKVEYDVFSDERAEAVACQPPQKGCALHGGEGAEGIFDHFGFRFIFSSDRRSSKLLSLELGKLTQEGRAVDGGEGAEGEL